MILKDCVATRLYTVFGGEGAAIPPWKHGYVRLFPPYAGSDARLFNSV